MPDPATIRQIAERNVQMLTLKPSRGFLTGTTKARVVDGLRCEIEDGRLAPRRRHAGQGGGDETAPTPGRARPRRAGELPRHRRRQLGRPPGRRRSTRSRSRSRPTSTPAASWVWSGIAPGYTRGPLPGLDREPGIHGTSSTELLDLVERHSPYLDVFGRAMPLRRAVRLNGQEA